MVLLSAALFAGFALTVADTLYPLGRLRLVAAYIGAALALWLGPSPVVDVLVQAGAAGFAGLLLTSVGNYVVVAGDEKIRTVVMRRPIQTPRL